MHANLAHAEFSTLDEHEVFYECRSRQWQEWYNRFLAYSPNGGITIFHAAARWDIEALAKLGLIMLEEKKMVSHSSKFDDHEFSDSYGATPLEIAAHHGNTNIMNILLASADGPMELSTRILNEAVQNVTSGPSLLQSLFDHSGLRVAITESILELAMQNRGCGDDILKTIVSLYGDSICPHISESVMKHAANNPMLGSKLVELIADSFHKDLDTLATPVVFEAAISNENQNREVIASILSHAKEAVIPGHILETAMRNRRNAREITLLLFSRADRAATLSERLILTAASHSTQLCQDLIKMTLEKAKRFQFSTEIEHLIVRWCDVKLINLFLHVMDNRLIITKSMIDAAKDDDVKKILENQTDIQSLSPMIEQSSVHAADHDAAPSFYRCPIAQIGVLKDHTDEVLCSAYSPDGSKFASGSRDTMIRVYRCVGLISLGLMTGHERGVSCLAWGPDGRILASGSLDKAIRVWSTEVGAKDSIPTASLTDL